MSEKRQNKFLHPVFGLFSVLYIFSMILPAYCIPEHYMDEIINENKFGFRFGDFVQGYEALWAALITIFKSPVAFLGSLANFAVPAVWILFLSKIEGNFKLLKNFLAVLSMVSVLIWPVALKIGFLSGYYCWSIASIGICFTYAAMKSFSVDEDDILLDDKLKPEED